MTATYNRPTKTKAAAVGERNRARWTPHLCKKLFSLTTPIEFLNAEEGAANTARKLPWDDRPRWATLQIRIEQVAVIEMLQARHLKATGKEISKAEVLAALMAEGLERILDHANFGGGPPDDNQPSAAQFAAKGQDAYAAYQAQNEAWRKATERRQSGSPKGRMLMPDEIE